MQTDKAALGLTGKVISAVLHIPYIVGIADDGTFELTPRLCNLTTHDDLYQRANSASWTHTVVGWTGEVKSVLDARHDQLRGPRVPSPQALTANERLKNKKTPCYNGLGSSSTLPQRLRKNHDHLPVISVTQEQHQELVKILEKRIDHKIVPVWLDDWTDASTGTLILQDQSRWTKYGERLLVNSKTAADGAAEREQYDASFADCQKMNKSIADVIIRMYKPGDVVWVHGHHLMLVPDIVRQRIPSAYIYYSQFAELCSKDFIESISESQAIKQGLSGASLCYFASKDFQLFVDGNSYSQPYVDSTKAITGIYSQRLFTTNLSRIINVTQGEIDKTHNELILRQETTTHEIQHSRKTVVALVWVHQPQMIMLVLDVFEHLLDCKIDETQIPALHLIMFDPPAIDPLSTGKQHASSLEFLHRIANINTKFGSHGFKPVTLADRDASSAERIAVKKDADVGIVAVDDEGCYCEAIDFMLSQQKKYSPIFIPEPTSTETDLGPLSDSRWTFSTDSYGNALKIREALFLDETAKEHRYNEFFAFLHEHMFAQFADATLSQFSSKLSKLSAFRPVPLLALNSLSEAYRTAKNRLFMFDYDGTLTQIVNDPDAAVPTEALLASLSNLATDRRNRVWIVSGRSRMFLEKHFGSINFIGLIAEHGSFVRWPTKNEWEDLSATMNMDWKVDTAKVFDELVGSIDGSWIEQKEVAMVWHYRNSIDHEACLTKATEAKALLEDEKLRDWDVEVMLGKANLEVRPRFLNKGAMATKLIDETFGNETHGFVLCAGDDTTDEDMFRALLCSKLEKESIFSCLVAKEDKQSLAYFRVEEPADLVSAITLLSEQ